MSATARGPRPHVPTPPTTGRLTLPPLPEVQEREGATGMAVNALPMLGSVAAIVLVTSAGGGDRARSLVVAGIILLSTLGFIAVQVGRQRTRHGRRVSGSRVDYLRRLAGVRSVVREAADRQRRALRWHHPDPADLPVVAEERTRLWRPAHGVAEEGAEDGGGGRSLEVRWGLCPQPLALGLALPDDHESERSDPVAAEAARNLLAVHRVQPDLPAVTDLAELGRLELCGEEEPARALVRALVCSAAAAHGPDRLAVAVLCAEEHLPLWDWLKWLPHARSDRGRDAVGPSRMVTTDPHALSRLLPGPPGAASSATASAPSSATASTTGGRGSPHLLLLLDGGRPVPSDALGPDGRPDVTVVDLPARWARLDDPSCLRLELTGERPRLGKEPVLALRLPHAPVAGLADQCDLATAEAFARRLAPLPTTTQALADPRGGASPDLLGLLDVVDPRRLDPETLWRRRPERDRLRVAIGITETGAPAHLDIKESAQQGMGPHGLVIGATGSGKSELLRTLVLGLALTHPPQTLNMVLVDFKGGATFAGLADLPHVSAVITNLEDDLTLVDRMQDALSGEMVRRQELLRRAGNHASVRDYERARLAGAPGPAGTPLDPLPSLFIVVDEFSEMLTAKPELIDLFVAIGRLGRSLGLHLLLASQRLEEGRLRGLESHLSYRVGLRTFSAAESRTVLGVPDAYRLPNVPGLGYLKPDPTALTRFKASHVSGPLMPDRGLPDERPPRILPFSVAELHAPEPRVAPAASEGTDGTSLLDVVVRRLRREGPRAHPVWLPPLEAPETLADLMPDLVTTTEHGLTSPRYRARGGLRIPLGTVDRPREQRRDTLEIDLTGAGGHVAVIGGPRSGKSTLLRTLTASLALSTTPTQTQLYVLDFGGGTFTPFTDLPHLAGIATRSEPDVVRRIVAEVTGIVEARERYFRDHAIDSIETYRHRRTRAGTDRGTHGGADGGIDDGYGDVFLLIDGWATIRSDFDELEQELMSLAQRGLTYGLHLLVGAARWADLRATVRDIMGTRLELRLGDATDSEIDRKTAKLVPENRPGRGLVTTAHHFLTALPRIDTSNDTGSRPDTLGAGVTDLVTRIATAWRGPTGPKLRLLPEHLHHHDLLTRTTPTPQDRRLWLGIDERDLAPVALDPDHEPHLLVYGDTGSGKSTLLRTYLREVLRTRGPEAAQLLVVDPRRSVLGEVPDDQLLGYLTGVAEATPVLRDLATHLVTRLPGPQVTVGQLRDRSWWTGAEVFVVVDDHDLTVTSQGSAVAALAPLLPQARDVGLHVVVARRTGGASRSQHEPVVQALRDLAAPGLVLPGSPDEGPLIGPLRAQPGPPGRARLVTRAAGARVVQLACTEPTP